MYKLFKTHLHTHTHTHVYIHVHIQATVDLSKLDLAASDKVKFRVMVSKDMRTSFSEQTYSLTGANVVEVYLDMQV